MKQYDVKVNFPIALTKRNGIAKVSMKNVLAELLTFYKRIRQSFEAFVTDSTGREFFFTLEDRNRKKSWYDPFEYSDFILSCELTEDETTDGSDVFTYYAVSWLDGRHTKLDHEYAEYRVEKV